MAKKNPELPEFVKRIAGVVLIIVGSLLGALIAAAADSFDWSTTAPKIIVVISAVVVLTIICVGLVIGFQDILPKQFTQGTKILFGVMAGLTLLALALITGYLIFIEKDPYWWTKSIPTYVIASSITAFFNNQMRKQSERERKRNTRKRKNSQRRPRPL